MNWADLFNGSLEVGSFILQIGNIRRLLRDKIVRGVHWGSTAFFAGWGAWNCYFYPHLHQWFSFAGGIGITAANGTWVALAIIYTNRERTS